MRLIIDEPTDAYFIYLFQSYYAFLVRLFDHLHDSLYVRVDVRKPSPCLYNCMLIGVSTNGRRWLVNRVSDIVYVAR